MVRKTAIKLVVCQLFMVLACLICGSAHAGLDAPHNGTRSVGCLSCHRMTSTYPKLLPPLNHTPVAGDIDDTTANGLCWSCHNDTTAPYVKTHSSLTTGNGYGDWTVECWVCHNQHSQEQDSYNGSTYGKFIRRTVNLAHIKGGDGDSLGKAGIKGVKFLGPTGANSFADGDATIDGICEVCHTQTTHFHNDGNGPDQLHANINGGQAGANCMTCHDHANGFAHGGPGTGCGTCHGGDPKHQVHLALLGDCAGCHDTNYFPTFISGTDANGDGYYSLTETDVCDSCHKNGAGGAPEIIADVYKPGWKDNIFDIGCGDCHGYAPGYANGSPKINSHQRHDTYGFSCGKCHYDTTHDGAVISDPGLHINNIRDVTFADPNVGYNPGTHTCVNTYCHSSGIGGTENTGDPRTVQENTSAAWGAAGPLACDSCHDFPPDYPNSNFLFNFKKNAHNPHAAALSCEICHYDTTTDGLSITTLSNHVNSNYDVVAKPGAASFNYVYGGSNSGCSAIGCHLHHYPDSSYDWAYGGFGGGNIYLSSSVCYGVNVEMDTVGFYRIDWGDGTPIEEGNDSMFFHQYPPYAGSTYYAKVYAGGSQNPDTLIITPEDVNTWPVVARGGEVSGYTVTLTDLSYDPDYNICGHSGSGTIHILWGDGKSTMTSIPLTDTPSNQVYTHTYSGAGTFTIQHYVTDNSGKKVGGNGGSFTVPYYPPVYLSGKVTLNGSPYANRTIYLKTTTNGILSIKKTDANGDFNFGNASAVFNEECFMVEPSDYWNYNPNRYNNICETRNDLDFVYQ